MFPRESLEDLYHVGVVAALEAEKYYDISRGTFTNYTKYTILGAMQAHCQRRTVGLHSALRQARVFIKGYERKHKKVPTLAQVAQYTNKSVKEIKEILEDTGIQLVGMGDYEPIMEPQSTESEELYDAIQSLKPESQAIVKAMLSGVNVSSAKQRKVLQELREIYL